MDMIASRIERVHRPYHARIAAGLGAMKERFGAALLCDLHSMPPLPAAQAADIVLGDRHGRTAAPALVDTAAAWLTQQGYRDTRNRPYAGELGRASCRERVCQYALRRVGAAT